MSNDTPARTLQRRLLPSAAPAARPTAEPTSRRVVAAPSTQERGEPAYHEPVREPALPETAHAEPSLSALGRSVYDEIRTEPTIEPPAKAEPQFAKSVVAKPMHAELTRPLSELIQRRTSTEFNKVFEDLVGVGVSDVHLTRSGTDGSFTVEARVDGKKQPVHRYEGSEAKGIVNLLKSDAKLTTDPTVVPEDGSYPLPMNDYPYRARAVALPTFDGGERIVFRLPQIGPLRRLHELGFTSRNLDALLEILAIPGGMTLVAGPTAEGKSTTSLAMLQYLQEEEDGVVLTLEDPVERVMPGMVQMEVKDEVKGASFADIMRYLVRADANILFIGEIRDKVTATAAVEIAKAGRRVVATIHAKDNLGALQRLVGLADDIPLSILEAVNGVISQRLVPRLVPGTERFAGRYPLHEVTLNSDELSYALMSSNSPAEIRAAAAATSTTFKQNVDELVAEGITTLAEARKTVRNV